MVLVLISNWQGTQGCFTSWLHPRLLCHSGKLEKKVWCSLKRMTRRCPQKWKKKKSLTCLKILKRYAACLRLLAAGGVSSPLSIGWLVPLTPLKLSDFLLWSIGSWADPMEIESMLLGILWLQPLIAGGHPRHGSSCLPSRTRPGQEG